MTRNTRIKVEERFPITGQGFASGKTVRWHGISNSIRHRVLQSHTCQNHVICNAKLYMHYQNSPQTSQRIQVGNGQYVSVLFVIPVIIDIHET